MPSIRKMLKQEAISIKNHKINNRKDGKNILISVEFADGHIHHILPGQETIDRIANDLINKYATKITDNQIPKQDTNGKYSVKINP